MIAYEDAKPPVETIDAKEDHPVAVCWGKEDLLRAWIEYRRNRIED